MLVPATKARSIDPQNTPNRGDQWGIRPAGRTPGRPAVGYQIVTERARHDISVGARGARLALVQRCENAP